MSACDIPGLIEGAAEGAGLGIRFLKHLQRTRLLLHVVDLAPLDPATDVAADAATIVSELERFSPELAARPRWLVFNKLDLLDEETAARRVEAVVSALGWEGPVFRISALAGTGTEALCRAVMNELEAREEAAEEG